MNWRSLRMEPDLLLSVTDEEWEMAKPVYGFWSDLLSCTNGVFDRSPEQNRPFYAPDGEAPQSPIMDMQWHGALSQ
jgi:hypothetical protein